MNSRIHPLAGSLLTHRDQLPSVSRYELLVKVASGGMATVYVGRLSGAVGFWRTVAIKRAHPHLLGDPAFTRMLIEEARLASKIHHPNVVAVQDVEVLEGELLLVMDYVEGAALGTLIGGSEEHTPPLPPGMAVRIMLDACAGLHAAHELKDDAGRPLKLVHRDISPHNILVGLDGMARIADFGIAKCTLSDSAVGTATGALKGKVAYMSPEYIERGEIDARGDVFALGVVAWEALTGKRLFRGHSDVETLRLALAAVSPPVSTIATELGDVLDAVIARALARETEDRFASARELGEALEAAARPAGLIASAAQVGEHVRALMEAPLERRRALIRDRTAPAATESAPTVATPVAPAEGHVWPAPADTDRTPGPRSEPEPPKTATLESFGAASRTATLPNPIDPRELHIADVTSTLASGVSSLGAAERPVAKPRASQRSRMLLGGFVLASILGLVITMGAATGSGTRSTDVAAIPRATTAPFLAATTSVPPSIALASSAAVSPSSTPVAASTATASRPAPRAASPSPAPARSSARPTIAASASSLAQAPPRARAPGTPPRAPATSEPAGPRADKAPPNPYATPVPDSP